MDHDHGHAGSAEVRRVVHPDPDWAGSPPPRGGVSDPLPHGGLGQVDGPGHAASGPARLAKSSLPVAVGAARPAPRGRVRVGHLTHRVANRRIS